MFKIRFDLKISFTWLGLPLFFWGWALLGSAIAAAPAGYSVYWSDEFDGAVGSAPSTANWGYDTGATGWGNGELENYTSSTANAQIVADGNATDGKSLAIITLDPGGNNDTVGSYTSARIKSQGLQAFQYGYIEARIRMPYGQGIWPAFWMLGSNIDTVSWPNCGEMDIMENIGKAAEQAINHGSMHGPGYSGGSALTADYTLPSGVFNSDYHTFGILWQANQVQFYVDGNLYETRTPSDIGTNSWVFNNPFFFVLNTAVGGSTSWPGQPDGTTSFPQTMLVDYVRVYEPDTATPTATVTSTPTDTPTWTATDTPSLTPSPAPSALPTATLVLTPPCGTANIFGNSSTSNTSGGPAGYNPGERASVFPLYGGAVVYSISLYAQANDAGVPVVAAIYGGVPGVIGSLMVQSAPQTLAAGWNVIPVQPTYLSSNYYWLAYMFGGSSYHVTAQTAAANSAVYTTSTVGFGSFSSSFTAPVSYVGVSDAIYANYCASTATPTNSPTVTSTPTVTQTPTATWTPTITDTPTPTSTATFTPTSSPTFSDTPTLTPTVTASWTNTPSASPTLTVSATTSPTATSTGTPTASVTSTPSLTASRTPSPNPSPADTASPTNTPTVSWSSTFTPSVTVTPTMTETVSETPSVATNTPTLTPSPTFTPTPTPTLTSTAWTPTPTSTEVYVSPGLFPNPIRDQSPVHLWAYFATSYDYVRIKVFTTAFRKIYEKDYQTVPAGPFQIELDGLGIRHEANGLYYVEITTPSDRWIKKLLILR